MRPWKNSPVDDAFPPMRSAPLPTLMPVVGWVTAVVPVKGVGEPPFSGNATLLHHHGFPSAHLRRVHPCGQGHAGREIEWAGRRVRDGDPIIHAVKLQRIAELVRRLPRDFYVRHAE